MTTQHPDEPAHDVWIRLLGSFSVSAGGKILEDSLWQLHKAKSIVKILALAPSRRFQRDRLIDLLWPDADPVVVADSLHHALRAARRALSSLSTAAGQALHVNGDFVSLTPPHLFQVDVDLFQAAAARAFQHDDPTDYRTAIALYAGELLPEDLYEEWAGERREELRIQYLDLLYGLASREIEHGEQAHAIVTLQRLVAQEPAHEEAQAMLMRLYALSGQRYQALRCFRQLERSLHAELQAEPGAAIRRLYQEIAAGQFPESEDSDRHDAPEAQDSKHGFLIRLNPTRQSSTTLETFRHNLPTPLSTFIGRQREIARVKALIDAPSPNHQFSSARLVTLTGPGGCGKTRLALAVADSLADSYPDGIWLIELAAINDALLVKTVATALGMAEQPTGLTAEDVAQFVKNRRLLLIFDNCEHLADSCAQLIVKLLHVSPALKILATSRERLHVTGEVVYLVPSLSLPDRLLASSDTLLRSEAVQLFLDRACAAKPDFTITDDNAAAIAAICHRLDGLPLAIELAAAWVGMLPLSTVLDHLDQPVPLLTRGARDLPTRQQTLHATITWSYNLLDSTEKVLFQRLSVFVGGCTIEAAEAVCADEYHSSDPLQAPETPPSPVSRSIFDRLLTLIDKNLLCPGEEPITDVHRAPRFRMLETIREYGQAQLTTSGEEQRIRRNHLTYFRSLAENSVRHLDQVPWLSYLRAEIDNLREALRWSAQEPTVMEEGLELAAALGPFWLISGQIDEGRRWLMRFHNLVHNSLAQPKAFLWATILAHIQNAYPMARFLGEQGRTRAEAAGDEAYLVEILGVLSIIVANQGDIEYALALSEEGVIRARALGDERALALMLMGAAITARICGFCQRAISLHEESLPLLRALGDLYFLAHSTSNLGLALAECGNIERARRLFIESIALRRRLDDRLGIAWSLKDLANLAFRQGDTATARSLYQESLTLLRDLGHQSSIADVLLALCHIAQATGNIIEAEQYAAEAATIHCDRGLIPPAV